ncbi:MAG TPA: PAS domain-containing protein, partial [Thermoanaerobaculia bacterium]|nr:PAS domain-containing protein [Thermoanaerobaculia bacterium]
MVKVSEASYLAVERDLDTSEGSSLLTFALLRGLPVHIARLDPQGTVRDTNHTWQDAALPSAGPPLLSEVGEGENYLELCARAAATGDKLAEEARQGIEQVLHGESRTFSLEYSCDDSPEANWYMVHAVALRSPDDGAIVAHLDITRRKRAQEQRLELQRALERAAFEWRSTFDAIESPILLLGFDRRLRRLNRAARNLLGRDFREAVGLPVSALERGQPWETV